MKPVTIYGLANEFGQVFYVGKSNNAARRFEIHSRSQWPFRVAGLAILEIVEPGQDSAAERKWIAFFGRSQLCNRTNGGNGAWAHPASDVTRKKMSEGIKHAYQLPGAKERKSAAMKAVRSSPEVRAMQSVITKQAWAKPGSKMRDLAVLQRIGEKNRREMMSPETRAKRSAAAKRTAQNAEIMEKRREGVRRAFQDPVVQERHREAVQRNSADPAIRRRISDGQKRAWADPDIRRRRSEALQRAWDRRKLAMTLERL